MSVMSGSAVSPAATPTWFGFGLGLGLGLGLVFSLGLGLGFVLPRRCWVRGRGRGLTSRAAAAVGPPCLVSSSTVAVPN